MAGVGLGAILVPQIASALIRWTGWRGAHIGLGGLMFAVAFPAVALAVREPDASAESGRTLTTLGLRPGVAARDAASSAVFWRMAGVFFMVGGAINGAIAHIVPLLTDRGLSPAVATEVFGVMGRMTLIARPFVGLLLDRFFAPHVAVTFFLAPLAGLPLLVGGSGLSPAIGAALLGLALGTEIDLIAFLTSRYLGQRAFGEVYGYLFTAFVAGSSLGQFMADVSFDGLGSYAPAFVGFAASLMAAVVLVNRLGPYVYQAQRRVSQ
jgi:hypothetical protein